MISVCLDEKRFVKKPSSDDSGKITNRIARSEVNITIDELVEAVGVNGQTFCPAIFNDAHRRAESFKEMQLFVLDFDGNLSVEEVRSISHIYGLPILFMYETLSSKDYNKFRVIFLNDVPVTDSRVAKIMILALMEIFNGCDTQPKSVCNMFFGGKSVMLFNEKIPTINIELLMEKLMLYYKCTYDKNYTRNIKAFAEKNGLMLKNGFIDILADKNEEINPLPLIYITIGNGLNFSKSYTIKLIQPSIAFNKNENNIKSRPKHKAIRNFNFDIARKRCQLFNDFCCGTDWLYYNQIFGLLTNLINVDGGESEFERILKTLAGRINEFPSYFNREWAYCIDYITKLQYVPNDCENYCPHKDKCHHAKNMVSTVNTPKHQIIELSDNHTYATIEDAQESLKSNLESAMQSYDDKIHVIIAQTALGKTTAFIQYLIESNNADKKCIIAVPTLLLAEEIYQKARSKGINIMKAHSVTDLAIDLKHKRYIDYLYSMGNHKKVIKYLRYLFRTTKNEFVKTYLEDVEKFHQFDGHLIITHKRLINMDKDFLTNYNVLIDEDLIKSYCQETIEVSVEDLYKLSHYEKLSPLCHEKIFNCLESLGEEYFRLEPISKFAEIDVKILKKLNITSNVNDFFKGESFRVYKNRYGDEYLQCFIKNTIPDNMKVTIVSATADEFIYKKYFGKDRVIFHYCKEARNMGRILQYADNSYSRSWIDKNLGIFDKIRSWFGSTIPIISFKKYIKESMNNEGIYFGKTEGHNVYEGKDIAVVGTPHYNDCCYKLLALALGIDIKEQATYREVEEENFRFWFHTYENTNLRHIQFWFLRSELAQAVGRARLLRNDCTVHLFANLPLRQAEFEEFRK